MLINNTPQEFFKPTRGIRHGDLLSPYLLILCINVFSVALCKIANNPKFEISVPVCPQFPIISCLFFVDDRFLFCKNNLTVCNNLNISLTVFARSHNNSLIFANPLLSFHAMALQIINNWWRQSSIFLKKIL